MSRPRDCSKTKTCPRRAATIPGAGDVRGKRSQLAARFASRHDTTEHMDRCGATAESIRATCGTTADGITAIDIYGRNTITVVAVIAWQNRTSSKAPLLWPVTRDPAAGCLRKGEVAWHRHVAFWRLSSKVEMTRFGGG